METRAVDLQLTGMTCAACAARIEKVLNRADGVDAAVNFATETAHVVFDAGKATPESLIEAVRKAGYDAAPAVDPFTQPEPARRGREARRYRREFSIFARRGAPHGAARRADGRSWSTGRHEIELPVWLQFALATPVQFWAGARFYAGAWKALRGGAANMDVLIALGTTAAFRLQPRRLARAAAGPARVLRGQRRRDHAGAARQAARRARAKARTAYAIRDLLKLQPATVRRERDGEMP